MRENTPQLETGNKKPETGCDNTYQPRDHVAESIMGEITQLPPEKLEAIKNYAVRLRKKHPHMKPLRLQRKVAEHFKIKLT